MTDQGNQSSNQTTAELENHNRVMASPKGTCQCAVCAKHGYHVPRLEVDAGLWQPANPGKITPTPIALTNAYSLSSYTTVSIQRYINIA